MVSFVQRAEEESRHARARPVKNRLRDEIRPVDVRLTN